MATSDDVLQYLLTKLQSEDGWSCANLAWNEDRLAVIADQFSSFDGAVKSKLLLSFLAMSPRVISSCRDEMLKLLRLARRDGDEWVRLFASVLAPFPDSQTITLEADSNASEVLEEIEESLTSNAHPGDSFVPHEYRYLNKSVLDQSMSQSLKSSTSNNHFTLLRTPRASSQLRADILQRAETDFSATGSLNRDKTIHRQASASSSSLSFVPSQRVSSTPKSVPVPSLMQRRYREKGTKLLEIDEVPIAGRRKRKASEIDVPAKRANLVKQPSTPISPSPTTKTTLEITPLQTPTPDYAAALGTDDSAIQPHTPSMYNSNFTLFPSLNSPVTPNPSFTSPPPVSTSSSASHPLNIRVQSLASLKTTAGKGSGSASSESGLTSVNQSTEGRNPDYLNKILSATKPPATSIPSTSTTPTTSSQPSPAIAGGGTNSTLAGSLQQLASLGANLLGAAAAQNAMSNQNRQQLLQNQQRILMERQKLLQQIQQQNLLQAKQQQQQQQQKLQPHPPPGPGTPAGSSVASTSSAEPQQQLQPSTPAKQPSKGLKLSRQQLAVAQEIFREAPHLNKQQKALILAFMAGSRENPLPGHNVISIKLNQRQQQEVIQTPDGEQRSRKVQLETVFEMNYSTGQWRKLQVKRPLD